MADADTKPPSGRVDAVDQLVDLTGDGKLTKKCIAVGTGNRMPKPGAKVTVHYTGTLTTGSQFDSSRDRGEPITFTIGRGEVIKGWDQGVATMRKGERALLSIHHSLAYGEEGRVPTIPPAATLLFDVELLSWSSGSDVSEKKNGSLIKETLRASEEEWTKPTYDTACVVAIHALANKAPKADGEDEDEEEDDLDVLLKSQPAPLKKWTVTIGADDVPDQFEDAIKSMASGEVARFHAKFDPAIDPAGAAVFATTWKDLLALGGQAVPAACHGVSMVLELESFQQPPAFYTVKGVPAKLAEAERRKGEGNTLYKEKKLKRAVAKYESGLGYLEDNDNKEPAFNVVRVPLLLNMAAAQLELHQYFFAEQNCTKALTLEPANLKALCRRMKARRLRGDYESARLDHAAILALDPANASAKAEMDLINKALKAQKAKDKATFGGMFDKLAKKAPVAADLPKAKEDEKPDLKFLDTVPRTLYVTSCSEPEAIGEYHLNLKDTHRTYPIWHRKDPLPQLAAWRIFSDPYLHWKLGKLGEFEQGLGYVKSKEPHDKVDAAPMPHEVSSWSKVGTSDTEGWIDDDATKIELTPLSAGPAEPNPSQ